MANQYSNDSFKVVVEAKYGMSIGEVLRGFEHQGISLKEAAEKTGFRESTVKRHALKYGFRITNTDNPKAEQNEQELNDFYTALRSDRLNRVNVLSRSWRHKGDVIR
jgi:hypothetical protein